MPGALEGIKVLDFSEMIAAPVAGMLLASMGADVIKLEPPTGEPWRLSGQFVPLESKVFIALNVGKRSLAIDLAAPDSRQIIERLVASVDVVLVNYRADVPAKFGLDYETVSRANPGVVYVGNSAFGLHGPDAGKPGYDLVIQAMSGMLAGDRKVDDSGAPGTITATAIADFATGLTMAWAVCGALFARERGGRGQQVETTLLGTALLMQASRLVRVKEREDELIDSYLETLHAARESGCSWEELLDLHAHLRPSGVANICYRSYQTATSVITIAALSAPLRRRALEIIGVDDPRMAGPDIQPGTPEYRQMNADLTPRVEAIFRSKSAEQWIAEFEAAAVPCGPVRFIEELVHDPQVEAEGLVTTVDHTIAGPVHVIGPIIKMHETPVTVTRSSPALGEHNDEILAELGFSAAEITSFREHGAIR